MLGHRSAAAGVVVGLLLSMAGCSAKVASTDAGAPRTVDATVAPIADIVRQVVGNRAKVVVLIPEGVDSHTFEPAPSTVKSLTRADVLFMNGLHLEGSTERLARANMAKGSEIIRLGDLTLQPDQYAYDFTFPQSQGDPNPHLWMDPRYAARWSEIVRDVMTRRDPRNGGIYRANQARFAAVIDHLDAAIARSITSVPEERRKLLTYHDSFAYFSRRYGIPVLAAVQPSDFSEPSAKEIKALIEQLKQTHVPAVFGSEVFPSTVLAQVAREAGAQYVDKLRDDELPGSPGDANHTYIGLMVEDVSIITVALGGDPAPMAAVPTSKTWRA